MNFYKRFIGDYQRDTGHLTMIEHGAFSLLLDTFYATGRPLPVEKRALFRLIRAEDEAERAAVDSVLLQFWRPLPEDRETLRQQLGIELERDRQLLLTVAADAWFADGGYVNLRAIREMLDSQHRAEINRKTALEREERRRQKAQKGGE